jgi:hypothetical protein
MPPSNSSVTNGDITIAKSTAKELNPRSKPTEFLGPAGTTVVTFLTPLMAYLLFFGCNPTTGCLSLPLDTYKVGFQNGWPAINGKLWDWGAAGVYAGWYAFTVICWNILPGEQVEGTVLRNGKRKMYNFNGKSPQHSTQAYWLKGRNMDHPTRSSYHCWNLLPARWNRTIYLRIRPLASSHLSRIGQCYFPSRIRLRQLVLLGRTPRSGR